MRTFYYNFSIAGRPLRPLEEWGCCQFPAATSYLEVCRRVTEVIPDYYRRHLSNHGPHSVVLMVFREGEPLHDNGMPYRVHQYFLNVTEATVV